MPVDPDGDGEVEELAVAVERALVTALASRLVMPGGPAHATERRSCRHRRDGWRRHRSS